MNQAIPASPLTARRSGALTGRVRVPGDKSISLRSLILGALAVGETRITGLLEGEDVISTANAMQALGAVVERTGERAWTRAGRRRRRLRRAVRGARFRQFRHRLPAGDGRGGRLPDHGDLRRRRQPAHAADAAHARSAGADGRAHLGNPRRRPPAAVVQGARDPIPIEYEAPVPSAQLKSAVLLAGLAAPGATTVIEKEATRDHTEKMLKHFGASLRVTAIGEHGRRITLQGQPELEAAPVVVPADPSSAAFPLVAALIVPGSEIVLEGVMLNPLRTGLLHHAARDGRGDRERSSSATRAARTSPICGSRRGALKGVDVPAERAPTMIDEYPILAVAAAFAEGVTRMRGLKELRVKESDRLAATAAMLRANGVEVEIEGDDLIVHGKGRAAGGGVVATHMDHRIAMSALVMGLGSEQAGARSTTRPSSPRASRASST